MKIIVWRWQAGKAITLPMPWGPTVFIKPAYKDNPSVLAHEECHIEQMLEWGTLTYLRRHLWGWIVTRRIGANREYYTEKPCYEAGDEARK